MQGGEVYFYVMMLGLIFVGLAMIYKPKQKAVEEEQDNANTLRLVSETNLKMEQQFRALSAQIVELQVELEQLRSQAVNTDNEDETTNGQQLGLERRYADVFQLAKQGLPKEEIAKQLEMGTGEVELIMQLNQLTDSAQSTEKVVRGERRRRG
ncbi:hypothetical protein BEP19_07370 [Ammoniphilus oxalaticus]|uniref:DUF2802 domain-containing protein n=1 Tax=Ammoniphilus oxalaticus TaxID=66863 RepID=A0A419SJU7_9BACL|nr:hypothetical protein [Ammoniphilus oxalaticus]RKD24216.1 hypothetical protein BEP19_07370 [Ammoniphilus oxalaticus]